VTAVTQGDREGRRSRPDLAAATYGFPDSMLTLNGAVFTAAPRGGGRCAIELELAALGIADRHSRADHPQACGKVERFHQTLKRWLAKQPTAATVVELQAQLDQFASYYNTQRPHRALGRGTPAAAFTARPRRRRRGGDSSSHATSASDGTRSTTGGSSPCATTAGCTMSGWAAGTPARASWSWSPSSMCAC
jgi:Integrase core domain